VSIARILSNQGNGLYSIEIIKNNVYIIAKKNRLEITKSELYQTQLILENKLDSLNLLLKTINSLLNQAILTDIEDLISKRVSQRNIILNDIVNQKEKLERHYFRQSEVESELNLINNYEQETILAEAWCVDYTLNMSDYVEVANIRDEPNGPINLLPVFDSNIENLKTKITKAGRLYNSLGNPKNLPKISQVEHVLNSKPWSILYNLILMPVAQRWRPMFRIGKITYFNSQKSKCNITYQNEPQFSSVLPFPKGFDFVGGNSRYNIQINVAETNVKIDYMGCSGSVFSINDRVVVEYKKRNLDVPVVIGFADNPRRCKSIILAYIKNNKLVWQEITKIGQFLPGTVSHELNETSSSILNNTETHSKRMGYCYRISVNDVTKKEIIDVYTYKKDSILKNGIELIGPSFFNNLKINIAFPDEQPEFKIAFNNIIGLFYDGEFVWSVCFTNHIRREKPYAKKYEFYNTGTLQQDYLWWGFGEYTGLRLLKFDPETLEHQGNFFDVPLAPIIKAEYAGNLSSGTSLGIKFFYFNDYNFDFNLDYSKPGQNGGLLTKTSAAHGGANSTKDVSKLFGFDYSNDYLSMCFSTRPSNVFDQPTLALHEMVIDIKEQKAISHKWKISSSISPSNDIFGNFFPSEKSTDSNSSVGELTIAGILSAIEEQTDFIYI